jgi:hypothetical protein
MFYSGDLVGPIPANDTLMQQVKILLVYEGDKGGGTGGRFTYKDTKEDKG